MTNIFKVLMFIQYHGPFYTEDVVRFGVENNIKAADRAKNRLCEAGLVERIPIFNDKTGKETYIYEASSLWKGAME